MTTYESKITAVSRSKEEAYSVFSNLNNLEKVKDRIPADKIKSIEFDSDSCSIMLDSIGKIAFEIVNREPCKTIKFGTKESPVPFNFWIQFKETTERDCLMKLTMKAELPMMIKMMVGNKLQDYINLLADAMSQALNNYKL